MKLARRIWCAIFGHRMYRADSWQWCEIGCERCGLQHRIHYTMDSTGAKE